MRQGFNRGAFIQSVIPETKANALTIRIIIIIIIIPWLYFAG
jgi:hypothetical protein